jgi:hypothetical protein
VKQIVKLFRIAIYRAFCFNLHLPTQMFDKAFKAFWGKLLLPSKSTQFYGPQNVHWPSYSQATFMITSWRYDSLLNRAMQKHPSRFFFTARKFGIF